MNAVRAVLGCRARTRGIEAALRDLIAQGSCCIAQPHGQRRTAVTVKRMTSPRGRGGEGRGGGVESIDLSIIHHMGGGGGGGGWGC